MSAPPNLLYVGSYTRSGRSDGLHVFRHDPATGSLTHVSTVAEVDPSFLAFDSSRRLLFAVSEGLGIDGGRVVSYEIDPRTGIPNKLSSQPSRGGEPCHLCNEPSDRWLIVANHEHGSVPVFPIDADGRLGPMTELRQHSGSGPGPTQTGPHAHHVTFDPLGQRVLVTDKGIDQIVVYRLDSGSGKLVPNDPPFGQVHAGAAPRHLSFGADGRFAYVNGEADMTVAAMSYAPESGAMRELQVLPTLPSDAERDGTSTAEIEVHPSGRFVYVSNRGHDSVAAFAIDQSTGLLSPIGIFSTQGRTPRNFKIDPTGKWLYAANQESDTIVQFEIDQQTGALSPTGAITQAGAPVCLLFSM